LSVADHGVAAAALAAWPVVAAGAKDPSADRCLSLQVAAVFVLQQQDRGSASLTGSSIGRPSGASRASPDRLPQPV